MKKYLKLILIIIFCLALIIFISRLISPSEIDDVNPNLNCENKYLEKSQVFWVVPYFEGELISQNKTWCENILSMNKTLGLHGYKHTYHEFQNNITLKEMHEARRIFYDCFGYYPEIFKAPNLALSSENKVMIENQNMKVRGKTNQVLKKVYHCNNSGTLPNKFHDIF